MFLGLLFLSASLRMVTPEYCLTDLGLEVRDHGVSRVEIPAEGCEGESVPGLSPWLCKVEHLCAHVEYSLSVYVCDKFSPFINPIGLGPPLMTAS